MGLLGGIGLGFFGVYNQIDLTASQRERLLLYLFASGTLIRSDGPMYALLPKL